MSKFLRVLTGKLHEVVAEINRQSLVDHVMHMSGTEERFLAIVRVEGIETVPLTGMTLGEAAFDVLNRSGRAMRAREILNEVRRRGYRSQRDGGTVPGAVSYALALRARTTGDVVQPGKGLWRSKLSAS